MISPATVIRELDPFPWYRRMRESEPVHFDPRRASCHVFRYDTVVRVLSDYATFSSQFRGSGTASPDQPFAGSVISMDPPRHRQLRALVTQAFTPRAVEAMAPRITTIVNELLDRAQAAGSMDVIQDFGSPLPVIVIAELLGIPVQDRDKFKQWSDAAVETAGAGGMAAGEYSGSPGREMVAYFTQVIEDHRRAPGDDLISGLLAAEVDGEHLTAQELIGFCSLLLVAGNETTTNLIGNALLTFTDHPEFWQRLRKEPALLPQTIEEVLRYRSPVQSMFRIATTDTELDGQEVPAGSFMVAWIGSANHDETKFSDPERFDIDRTPNRHIAFGYGIHTCLGSPLARLEARIAFGAMLERFSRIERAPDVSLERVPSTIVYGLRHLPITMS